MSQIFTNRGFFSGISIDLLFFREIRQKKVSNLAFLPAPCHCLNLNAFYNGLRAYGYRLRAGYTHLPSGGTGIDNGHRYKIPTHRLACEYEEIDDSDRGTESGVAFGLFSEPVPEGRDRFDDKSQ